jgi:hypothetical protein
MLIALLSLALSQSHGAARDAFEVWSADPGPTSEAAEPLEAARELVRGLTPGALVDEGALDTAAAARAVLDAEVARLREGLSAPRCTYSRYGPNAGAPIRLAETARVRALVGLRLGEEVTPLVLDVLAMGRRLARCARGPLLAYAAGKVIEGDTLNFALWASSHSLWSQADRAKLAAAFGGADALRPEDLQRPLDAELEWSLAHIPPAMKDEHVYSRAATERRLRASFARLRSAAAAKEPDLAAQRKALEGLLSEQEIALLQGSEALRGDPMAWMQAILKRGPPPGDDLFGRFFARQISLTLVDTVGDLRKKLLDDRARAKALSAAGASKPQPWARPADPSAAPSASAGPFTGRCERVKEGVYRLDAAAASALREQGEKVAVNSARLIPVFEGGKVIGFKISAFGADSFPASCGFREQDVIVRVNETVLRAPQAMMEAFAGVRRAGKADFSVLRGGASISFSVVGRD